MKKFSSLFPIILLILAMLPVTAVGQEWRDNKGVFIGLNLGLGEDVNIRTHDDADYFAKIIPTVGYRFNHRWSVGAEAEVQAGIYRQFNPVLRVYGEYNFLSRDRWDVFVRSQGGWGRNPHQLYAVIGPIVGDDGNLIWPEPTNYNYDVWEYGFKFGADFYVTPRLAVRLEYPFIGFVHTDNTRYKEGSRGNVRSGDFTLDFGVRRLLIGLRYTF